MLQKNENLRVDVLDSALYKDLTSLGDVFPSGEMFLNMVEVFAKYHPEDIPIVHAGTSLFVGPSLKKGVHAWNGKYGGGMWARNIVFEGFFRGATPSRNISNLMTTHTPKIIGANFNESEGSSVFMFYSPCEYSNNKYSLVSVNSRTPNDLNIMFYDTIVDTSQLATLGMKTSNGSNMGILNPKVLDYLRGDN